MRSFSAYPSARRMLALSSLALFLFIHPLLLPAQAQLILRVDDKGDLEDANPGDGECKTKGLIRNSCTLRAAIMEANASPNSDNKPDQILIDASPIHPSLPVVISPSGGNLIITDPVIIDASDSDYRTILKNTLINQATTGLTLGRGSSGSTIRGLVFGEFTSEALSIQSDNNLIVDNYFGIDSTGDNLGNDTAIEVIGNGNTIGSENEGNVFANNEDAIIIFGNRTTVLGNHIGYDPESGRGSGHNVGIDIKRGIKNVIGSEAAPNIIAFSEDWAIIVGGAEASNENTISSNWIGIDKDGNAKASEVSNGIYVQNGNHNLIKNNYVGDFETGIHIADHDNIIEGNQIGIWGHVSEQYITTGIWVAEDIKRTLVGGSKEADGNIIGKVTYGILIQGSENNLYHNSVGVSPQGDRFGINNGILVTGSNNLIGAPGEGNVVGFAKNGMVIEGSGNTIQGNYVGLTREGLLADNNNGMIVGIDSGKKRNPFAALNTQNNQIGGTSSEAGNVFGYNKKGIYILIADDTHITGNFIGEGRNGEPYLTQIGVWATGDASNVIVGYGKGEAIDPKLEKRNHMRFNQTSVRFSGRHGAGTFRGNSHPSGLAIDLAPNSASGNSMNDAGKGDADEGPNRMQNYPVISAVSYNPTSDEVEISYRVPTRAQYASYPITVDFYIDGHTYLGTHSYTTPEELASFGIEPDPDYEFATMYATATDADGHTSEFSVPFRISEPLPVELSTFTAVADGSDIILAWETASEINNAGFEVQTRSAGSEDWIVHTFIEGHGTTDQAQAYHHRIERLSPATYEVRLKQLDFDGAFEYSDVITVALSLDGTHELSPAFPNPFNPQTTFSLTVYETGPVRISVHDLLGRRVALLHDGDLVAGAAQTFRFEADGLASGTYLLQVQGNAFLETQKLILLK